MLEELQTEVRITVGIASLFMAIATYLVSWPLVSAILSPNTLQKEIWHREQPRWQRLRQQSRLFSSFDRWIVGLSVIVDRHLPWLVAALPEEHPTQPRWMAFCAKLVQLLFGNPKATAQASRILSSEHPWSVAELVAIGLYSAGGVFLFVCLLCLGSVSLTLTTATALIAALGTYRVILASYIRRAGKTRKAIRSILPHAMDLIAVVVTAGESYISALDAFISDFPTHPLGLEFRKLRMSMESGQIRVEALDELAYRVSLPELDDLVRVLRHIQKHGSPAGNTLFEQAKNLRQNHLRNMETEIGKSETKMSIPKMFVLFACMLTVLAPFILSVLQNNPFDVVKSR